MHTPARAAAAVGAALLASAAAFAAGTIIFQDDFTAGPSPDWSNQLGAWTTQNGEYFATQPSNSPPTYTLLPDTLRNFVIEADIKAVSDGGIWCRVDSTTQNGVLLVTGGNLQSGTGLYWHTITNGAYSGQMNQSPPQFVQGQDIHIRVVVSGDTYQAFVNGSSTPATTLTTSAYTTGQTGLYDFASPAQRFDNVVVIELADCPGDLNGDGAIDSLDLNVILGGFGCTGAGCQGDINRDGKTDSVDLNIVLAGFGSGCS